MKDKQQNDIKEWLAAKGQAEGFDICAVTAADLPAIIGAGLDNYLQAGHHGDMGWMAETRNRRTTPTAMWDAARTVVILSLIHI